MAMPVCRKLPLRIREQGSLTASAGNASCVSAKAELRLTSSKFVLALQSSSSSSFSIGDYCGQAKQLNCVHEVVEAAGSIAFGPQWIENDDDEDVNDWTGPSSPKKYRAGAETTPTRSFPVGADSSRCDSVGPSEDQPLSAIVANRRAETKEKNLMVEMDRNGLKAV
jgi:hypothetical protein